MDKFFTLSAGVTLGVMLKEMYMYYYIKQIDHKIKTSINVDLSYEKLVKELDNKPILIASSISNIVNTESKSDNNTLFLKSNLLTKETGDKLLKVIYYS